MRLAAETWPFAVEIAEFREEAAAEIAALGVDGVGCQFGARWPGPWAAPEDVPTAECVRVRALLRRHGLGIAYSWGHWASLVNLDEDRRRAGVDTTRGAVRVARDLGAPCVVTGPGSNSPAGGWEPHPDNHTEAAFDALVRSLRELVPAAEDAGVRIVLKGRVGSALDTPQRMREAVGAVGSPMVRAGADPVNLMRRAHVGDGGRFLRRLLDELGPVLAVAHAKDAVLVGGAEPRLEERPPGQGVLDYGRYVRLLAERHPGIWLVIEHVPRADLAAAVGHVDACRRALP